MVPKYKIHPAIGVARLGNSPDDFCITPETHGGLPVECDKNGKTSSPEKTITRFRDAEGRIKRQAARFRIFVEDEEHPEGRQLKIGDTIEGGGNSGTLLAIEWRAYLANKKSAWYEFDQLEGEHGYAKSHPLRNSDITDPDVRQKLIIDPGPQAVSTAGPTKASFSRGGNSEYAQTFPPENLSPNSIDTLGDLLVDKEGGLLVLAGHGNSGSCKTGLGEPRITDYANNDGWFDDTSDGPVMARLKMKDSRTKRVRYIDVEYPAWVLCAYPSYVPSILDMITMEDVLEDLEIREFAGNTYMYGARSTFGDPQKIDQSNAEAVTWWRKQDLGWNENYYPQFQRDIWPILERPNKYGFLSNILSQSNAPHDETDRGTFDPGILANPKGPAQPRVYLYNLLRQAGEENLFSRAGKPNAANGSDRTANVPLMPLLCGDNPITNDLPSKFLRLTATQLFILKQWAEGKFVNDTNHEEEMGANHLTKGHTLDRAIMSSILGGAFCPGGEVGWIMRNPSIYREPYRIKADPNFSNFRQTAASATGSANINQAYITDQDLSQESDFDTGLQPGDLTKTMSIPWQADYNECTIQTIDVTYDLWNKIYPTNEGDSRLAEAQKTWVTLWWPAHHPMQSYEVTGFQAVDPDDPAKGPDDSKPNYAFLDWDRGIPATNEGNLKMVTAWKDLGFVVKNPFPGHSSAQEYISVERTGETPIPKKFPLID